MKKEIKLQIVDPVGTTISEMTMLSNTINNIGRNRMILIDNDKIIGTLKVIDDGEGNIINIELDKELK